MYALGGSGSSPLGGFPAPRDGEGSLDEADALPCGWFRVGSGIDKPSGEMYWMCYGDVNRWEHHDRKTRTVASAFCSAQPRLYPLFSFSAIAAASNSW